MFQLHNSSDSGSAQATVSLPRGWSQRLSDARQFVLISFPLWDWVLAGALGMAALAVNLHRIAGFTVWYDEDYSFGIASQSLSVMWRSIWGPYQNMTLYYLFLHGWLGLLHTLNVAPTEVVLRGPSAIFSALSVVVVFLIGRRYWDTVTGVAAATLYLFSFWQVYAAQEARAYGLLMLLLCLGWYALFAALDTTENRLRKRWWIIYVLVMTLAIYDHLWSGLIVIAQVAALAGMLVLPGRWQMNARHSVGRMIVSLGAILVLILPIAWDVKVYGGASTWIAPAQISDMKDFLYFTF